MHWTTNNNPVFYGQFFFWRNNGLKKLSGNIGNHARNTFGTYAVALYCIGITYAVQIVDRQTKIIWRSGKSPIIIIPRMPQFPNATTAFSGNACVTCSSMETPLRVKKTAEMQRRGDCEVRWRRKGGRERGMEGRRTCSPFVTDSASPQQAENTPRT